MSATIKLTLSDYSVRERLDGGSARVFAHFGLRPSPWR